MASSDIQFRPSVTKRFAVLNSIKEKPTWEIPQSWNSVLYNQVVSTNGTSTSQLQFPLTNISSSYLLGNCPIVKAQMTAIFTATNKTGSGGAPHSLFIDGQVAPNAFPLNKSCQSSVVNLGGGQILTSAQDFFAVALSSHADFFKDLTIWSGCANQVDVYNQFGLENQTGNPKNVLGSYANSIYGNAGRMAQSYITAYDNAAISNAGTGVGNATISWTVWEPIFNGLLSFDPSQETTISGLVSNGSFILMNLVNLSGNAIKIVPDSDNFSNVSSVVTFDAPPVLYYTLYDPYPLAVPTKSYYKCIEYNNRGSSQALTPAAGVIQNATVSLQDTLINKAIYVWMNPVLASAKTCLQGDSPQYYITNLQVQYGNQPSQFTTYDEYALYKYFVAEQGGIKGLNETRWSTSIADDSTVNTHDDLADFALYGSVLRIPSEMLCGYDRTKLGVGSAYLQNLQVTVTATYTGAAAEAPAAQLFVQCVDESLVCIENGTLVDLGTTGIVTPDVVASVMTMAPIIYEEADGVGGGIFSKLGTLARKAVAHYNANKETYNKIANKVLEHPLTQKAVSNLASKVGLGEGRRMHHRRGRGLVYDSSDDEMHGGSLISQSSIANRLKNL